MRTPSSEGHPVKEVRYKYPLDERIEWARIAIKASRVTGTPPAADMIELAAVALPWEDEAPAEYVSLLDR